jgi:hypothetical protein
VLEEALFSMPGRCPEPRRIVAPSDNNN